MFFPRDAPARFSAADVPANFAEPAPTVLFVQPPGATARPASIQNSMKPYFALALLLCLLAPVRAGRDDPEEHHRRPETGRAVLYSGENFEGVAVELLPGAVVPNLGDLRFSDGRKVQDRISSVRVFGPLKVELYSDSDFRGEKLEVDSEIARLNRVPRRRGSTWDNCVSSVRISGGHPGRDERDRDDDRGRGRHPGRRSVADAERLVTRAYRELLQREPNAAELRHHRDAITDQDWDRAEVYDDIRASREYRSLEAERIIERTYRDLLGRAPDPSGRAKWRRKLMDDDWSEGRLRDEIRRSDEYRRRERLPPGGH